MAGRRSSRARARRRFFFFFFFFNPHDAPGRFQGVDPSGRQLVHERGMGLPFPAGDVQWSRATSGDPRARPDATCGTCRDIARRLGLRRRCVSRAAGSEPRGTSIADRQHAAHDVGRRWSEVTVGPVDHLPSTPMAQDVSWVEIAVEQALSPDSVPSMPHDRERGGQLWKRWGREIVQSRRAGGPGWNAAPRSSSSEGPSSRLETKPVRPRTATISYTAGQGASAARTARARSNSIAGGALRIAAGTSLTTVSAVHA